eukprot:6207481-Pleurochrysis_carterae.AAC.2
MTPAHAKGRSAKIDEQALEGEPIWASARLSAALSRCRAVAPRDHFRPRNMPKRNAVRVFYLLVCDTIFDRQGSLKVKRHRRRLTLCSVVTSSVKMLGPCEA